MSPQKRIRETNAIVLNSKSDRYDGGIFAHQDIAFEFASWLSPELRLYVIQEFQRLKENELYQNKLDWYANRVFKVNYLVHTYAIKNFIVPSLTENQKRFLYAEETEVLNVALFGMAVKEWREKNPSVSDKGNIRDYTDLLHLVILNNIESINVELIKIGMSQRERPVKLNSMIKI